VAAERKRPSPRRAPPGARPLRGRRAAVKLKLKDKS
jgi:hypothetical protein